MWVRIPPGALALVLAVSLTACSSGKDHDASARTTTTVESAQAEAWTKKAGEVYAALRLTATELPTRVRDWQQGGRSDGDLAVDLNTAASEVATVRDGVAALPAFARDSRVQPLYLASAKLYVEYVNALRAAQGQPPGPMRDQLVLLARRLRVLGDRVFDRGQARLAPFLPDNSSPDVEIHLPPEVPDWNAEGLAAGPPLDDPPPPPATTPALREDTRPVQPKSLWRRAVRAAGAPTTQELASALSSGDPAALRTLARRYADVARALGPVPDPKDDFGRDDAAQIRLAFLVLGEAARAGQVPLADMARRLQDLGAGVLELVGAGI